MKPVDLLRRAVELAHAGRRSEARDLFIHIVEIEPRNEIAWMWLTGLVDGTEDKIIACENVLALNPANDKVRAYLQNLLQQQAQSMPETSVVAAEVGTYESASISSTTRPKESANPLLQAEQLEQEGRLDEALQAYELLAAKAGNSYTFDHIYRQITRLESLKREAIQFVAPSTSILRMSFTWPILYFGFALLQVGLNPITHPALLLWLGLPVVALGSFLLALSEVRMRHVIWQKIFLEEGMGSNFARAALAVAGWAFVLLPFALMLVGSLARLQDFQIPPAPGF